MRSRVIAAFCLFVLLLVTPGIALGYDWKLGNWGNLNLRGDITYGLRLRTEYPAPQFVDPRSPYFISGNANFEKWELGNNGVVGTAEVILDSRNITFFGRVVGLVDFAYIDEDRFNSETREHAAYNITDGLEFYLEGRTGNFTTRWGRQIIQWGESTAPIWAPGVNVPSPYFLQRVNNVMFNQRSWQVPTLMAWGTYEFSESLSVEGVWAPDFDPRFYMPVVGTYLSPADILGFGVEGDFVRDLRPEDWADQQQGGAAIRMVLPQLNNLELGLYYYNYLSRWPMLTLPEAFPPNIFIEWPRTNLIGISFSQAFQNVGLKLLDGIQVGGELTYRPDEPLQLENINSPFIASVSGLEKGVAGFERSNTLAWDINFFKMYFDVLSFTRATFGLSPILEFYGKINLDHNDELLWYDPQFTAWYNLICPLTTSDLIDNTRLNLNFSAMGGMHKEKNLQHSLGFSAAAKYGNSWEVLIGYNLTVWSADQDPQGQFTGDRDNFVFKLTYYFI
jgi:hypothetical protein